MAVLVSGIHGGAPSCCYCQEEDHSSRDCKIVTQPEDRKQILQKSGHCFICLRAGHISRECRSKSSVTGATDDISHVSICSNNQSSMNLNYC